MRLHTVLVVAFPTLEIRRAIASRSPDCFQFVPISGCRSINRCDAVGRFGRCSIVDVDVDGLIMWMRRGGLSDGRGAFRHEEFDDFSVLTELLHSLELIESLLHRISQVSRRKRGGSD